jgi:hypothetical protein
MGMVVDYCDTFEAKFSSNEDEFNPEQMQQYISAATYMEARFCRKGMQRQVREKLNSLPF